MNNHFPDLKRAKYYLQHLTGVKTTPLPPKNISKNEITDDASFSGDSAGECRGDGYA